MFVILIISQFWKRRIEMKEQETKELPKVFYTVEEFHRAIGGIVTKTQIYRLINSGQIPARRFGSKVILSAKWVESFLNEPFDISGTKGA